MATLIEQQAGLEEVVNLLPVAQGKMTVTEVLLQRACRGGAVHAGV